MSILNKFSTARKTAPHILAIDDEEDFLWLFVRILREVGLSAEGFLDPHKAIDRLTIRHPEMMIVDLELNGGTSGIDVIQRARKAGYANKVILMSGYPQPDWVPEGVRFISKGFCSVKPVLDAIAHDLNINLSDYAPQRARQGQPNSRISGLTSRATA
jgi:DNA-binding NtrC family response regulator